MRCRVGDFVVLKFGSRAYGRGNETMSRNVGDLVQIGNNNLSRSFRGTSVYIGYVGKIVEKSPGKDSWRGHTYEVMFADGYFRAYYDAELRNPTKAGLLTYQLAIMKGVQND